MRRSLSIARGRRGRQGARAGEAPGPEAAGERNLAFYLFCAFIVSYFCRLTARVPLLAVLHFDFLLAALTLAAIVFAARRPAAPRAVPFDMDLVSRRLWILIGYIIVTFPLVQWPGSVIRNLEPFLKSVCFFFFVVATVDTTRKLGVLLAVYAATQTWRVLEPLGMHLKSGYWGSFTSLGNWEYMDRLSGSPYDIINPNGLGFVVIMILPMLQFLVRPDTTLRRAIWAALAAAMCYALVLSASRSAFLAAVFLCVFAVWRSKYRAAWLAALAAGLVLTLGFMTTLHRDRYLSIVSENAPGAATAQGRIAGVIEDFKVSLRRPLFGHGLGTSTEANAHYRGVAALSHNLYTETAEELGYVGLGLVIWLIWGFLRECRNARLAIARATQASESMQFLARVASALIAVVAVDLFFSFAAYGLSEPYWYFIGGLSVVTSRLVASLQPAAAPAASGRGVRRATPQGSRRLAWPRVRNGLRGRART